MRTLALLFAAIAISLTASAHQMKAALTELYLNPRTGNLEVAHRFYVHDAEKGLANAHGIRLDLINDPEARAKFSTYVVSQFEMRDPAGDQSLELVLLGSEIERGFIWVYQEIPAQDLPGDLLLSQNSLREVWPDQINTVNIIEGEAIETLTFTGTDQFKPVTLSTG